MRTTPRSTILATFGLMVLLCACAGENPFITIIDPPGLPPESRYTVEASIYPGDSSRVFITLTSAEANANDPRFQRGATVEVQLDDRPVVRFTEVEYEGLYSRDFDLPVRVVYYSYRFRGNELPTGTRVRLRVTLEDGTALTSEAKVPRSPNPAAADFTFSPETTGGLRLNLVYPDAPGPDYYLFRASGRAYYRPRFQPGAPPQMFPTDSAEAEITFKLERGFSTNFYGSRFLVDDSAYDGAVGIHLLDARIENRGGYKDSTLLRYALSTVNPAGYAYLRAAQRAFDRVDNILVEPGVIPSNVVGGLGALIVSSAPVRGRQTLGESY